MDLDADGHMDLISGSWPGELYLFRGGPGHTFGPPETIKDKDGQEINPGGGVRDWNGGGLMIVGAAKYEATPEGTFITYRGKRYESTAARPVVLTGCASAVHAADWDGDGDLDLIVGEILGTVVLYPNEGSARTPAFGKARPLDAAGAPVKVEGDAGPFTADWDNDGDLDLIVGAGDGAVSLFRNVGTAKAPRLAAAETLVPAGEASFGSDAPRVPRRGIRAKVCAADWNGDGRLDLLVGDFATQVPERPEPSAEEKAEQERLREQLAAVEKTYSQQVQKVFGPNRVKTNDEFRRANEAVQKTAKEMIALREKLPAEYDNHGWVWLFLRTSGAAAPARR